MTRRWWAALGVAICLCVPAVSARAGGYAPIDQPGPPLSVPTSVLASALRCSQNPTTAGRDITLFVPPTVFDPSEAYGWNYELALKARHWPFCTVVMPDHTDGDIQINAEYIVYAVRHLNALSHRQVVLFGWSQGASTSPRWALRWWPDIRPMVASLVGLAPDNEGGSNTVTGYCLYECVPAAWQQVRRVNGQPPHFMQALNSIRQTFPGIAYTDIYSLTDEVAGLNIITPAVSPLPPAPNVLDIPVQAICPLLPVEHLDIPASSAAYAVAILALSHPGHLPDLRDINRAAACSQPFMPYVTPASFVTNEAALAAVIPSRLTTGEVTSEPALRCYVTASCH